MDDLEKQLKKAGAILRAAQATPEMPPLTALRALEAARTEIFGASSKPLTTKQMQWFILKLLNEKAMDGVEMVGQLQKHRVKLETAGDGLIYGILAQAESNGLLRSEWREAGEEMTKLYRITEKGSGSLTREKATAKELAEILERGGVLE